MPPQKPGRSKQDYGTPRNFLDAVERHFGPIAHDLAAHEGNHVVPSYYSPEQNSLVQEWAQDFPDGNLWLNCPFGNCVPWAAKCAREAQKRNGLILSLTPAAVGTNWFAKHVHKKALVLALSPRLTFVGEKDAYIKDLILSVFGRGLDGFGVWRWDGEESPCLSGSTQTDQTVMMAAGLASRSRPSVAVVTKRLQLPPLPSSKSLFSNGSRGA